jgi:hypothetical protein
LNIPEQRSKAGDEEAMDRSAGNRGELSGEPSYYVAEPAVSPRERRST